MPAIPRSCLRAARAPVLLGGALAVVATLLSPLTVGAAPTGRTAVAPDAGVGQVVAWGRNLFGQANVPAGLRGVTAVAAGTYQSLAVGADGTVVEWGDSFDQIPDAPSGLSGVTAVAAGYGHNLALRSDGRVVAWGNNDDRQSAVPAGLAGVTAIAAGSGYPGFSLAVRPDGSVAAWGDGRVGQTTVPGGIRGVIAIDAGHAHALALRSDGEVFAWGGNEYDQRNIPAGLHGVTAIAAGPYHNLAVRSDGTVVAWGIDSGGQTRVPAGLTGVVAVAAGTEQSVALRSDGSVVSWGFGYNYRTPPTGLAQVTTVALGDSHGLAVVSQPWRTCGSPARTVADVTRVAGTFDSSTYGEDGALATRATLTYPKGLARDAGGALHIADTYGSKIRRIDPATGILRTVAGQRYYQPRMGDGLPAVEVYLDKPSAVAFSAAGDLLIADSQHGRIRRVDRVTGIISTFAGAGQGINGGNLGDGGPAVSASLSDPQGLVVGPDGSVYIADSGNHRVRRVTSAPRPRHRLWAIGRSVPQPPPPNSPPDQDDAEAAARGATCELT